MTKTLSDAVGKATFERMQSDAVLFVKAFETLVPWEYQERMLHQALERIPATVASMQGNSMITMPRGKYRYRRVIISLPRQNAKSTLSAWIALHRLYCGDGKQEIVSVANDTAHAGIILGDARRIISSSDVLYGQLDDYGLTRGEIRLTNGNRWLIKSSESVASRGLRPSLILYDELGWASDRMLYDTLR